MEQFDVQYWEEVWDNVPIPVEETPDIQHEIHHVLTKILSKGNLRLIEIGCAPGKWLAYFHNQFQFSVSGIEYAEKACLKTIENMRSLNIPAEIYYIDFFEFTHEPYDIVFSGGFIKYFKDIKPIIKKIVNLTKVDGGIVITVIPSMQGVNRWISKTFRPHVASGHFPISIDQLIKVHEEHGLQSLYSSYYGSLHFLPPISHNKFSKQHPRVIFVINLPFLIWNKLVSILTKRLLWYPKFGSISIGIIYVGKKI